KLMHIIGDAVFWRDRDNVIDNDDASDGLEDAAEEVGRKLVDQQVFDALRSKDYRSILSKIAYEPSVLSDFSFQKGKVGRGFSETEKKKFDNFLQRMKRLDVLRPGDERGEYAFADPMVWLYIVRNTVSN
ncbi:MAG: hypothetical protein HY880_00495, partial [Deltaproteobacteria bacterium]|nr:hypothetical protein [Deltaproteobacteria bacterium]